MTPGQNSIARAIDAIEEERANLAARLATVEQLLVTMREAFHLPAPATKSRSKATTPRRAKDDPADGPAYESKHGLAIQTALQPGPMTLKALAAAIGASPYKTNKHVAALVSAGAVVRTGATSTSRIALARAPKEAP